MFFFFVLKKCVDMFRLNTNSEITDNGNEDLRHNLIRPIDRNLLFLNSDNHFSHVALVMEIICRLILNY